MGIRIDESIKELIKYEMDRNNRPKQSSFLFG